MNESIPLCVCPSQVRASPHVPGLLPSQAFGIRGCAPLCVAQQALGQSWSSSGCCAGVVKRCSVTTATPAAGLQRERQKPVPQPYLT